MNQEDMMNISMAIYDGNITPSANLTTTLQGPAISPGLHKFAIFCWGLHKFFTPVIIVLGLVGNLMSFLVFVRTHIRCLSSSVYLAALAIADTGFLIQLFINWLNYFRIFLVHRQGWCQGVVYLSYVCSFLSVWYVVGFTVERYIAVCYPLKRQDMCTALRAKKVVIGLAIFAAVAYSFGAWTSGIIIPEYGLRLPECRPLPQYIVIVNILNNVDTVITLIIPSLTIFVLNLRLAAKIKYFYAKRMVMTATSKHEAAVSLNKMGDFSRSVSTRSGDSLQNSPGRQKTQMNITKMLLIVSSIFLILNLPSHAIRVQAFFLGFVDPNFRPSYSLQVWQHFFTIIYYTNFSVNFFLYSLCGKNFRSALKRMILKTNLPCKGKNADGRRTSRMKRNNEQSQDNTMKSFVTQAPSETNNEKLISDL